MRWGADPAELLEVRAMVGLSDALGRPGLAAVATWEVPRLVDGLLLATAHESATRYAERRQIAAQSLQSLKAGR